MGWAPTERFALLNDADPAASIAEPICVEPSRNATVPVGVPFPDCGATPAVNVTFCPLVNCVADAESEVAVAVFAAAATVKGTAADVDAEKLALPAYTAATECEPTARLEVVNVAAPEEFSVPVPICVAPSLNVTEPVGTPDPETRAIEAVNVTVCPKVICAGAAVRDAFVAAGTGDELAGVKTKTVAE